MLVGVALDVMQASTLVRFEQGSVLGTQTPTDPLEADIWNVHREDCAWHDAASVNVEQATLVQAARLPTHAQDF